MELRTRVGDVRAHGTTYIKVAYTNDSAMVPAYLSDFKKWLVKADEKERFIGLDLEYTANGKEVAVIQLCFKKHVLVFQWSRSDKKCPQLMDFLLSGIHFASVDIDNDKIKMRKTWGIEIPPACHIDIQRLFRLKYDKTSMADMAFQLIDEQYADMKKRCTVISTKSGRSTHLTVSTLSMRQ